MKPGLLKHVLTLILLLASGILLVSCGSSGDSSGSSAQGTLSVALTDSATEDYQAVYVTIARIEVHPGDGEDESLWETVAEPNRTYNLLELVNGVFEELGTTALDAGDYSQLRMIIGDTADQENNILGEEHEFANYVIDRDDSEVHELKVPSGPQTGLKIVNGFTIAPNQQTELILDFDATRSVVKAGNSGNYLLKPTVKVLETIDYASIYGTVSSADDPAIPLPGAYVTAQAVDPAASDPRDAVMIEAGTITEDNEGRAEYALFVAPGDYNVVATFPGYLAGCMPVALESTEAVHNADFSLVADSQEPGIITGTVVLAGASQDQVQSARIEIRQQLACGATSPQEVIVATDQIADSGDGGTYSFELPAGSYEIVAFSSEHGTLSVAGVALAPAATETRNLSLGLVE